MSKENWFFRQKGAKEAETKPSGLSFQNYTPYRAWHRYQEKNWLTSDHSSDFLMSGRPGHYLCGPDFLEVQINSVVSSWWHGTSYE